MDRYSSLIALDGGKVTISFQGDGTAVTGMMGRRARISIPFAGNPLPMNVGVRLIHCSAHLRKGSTIFYTCCQNKISSVR